MEGQHATAISVGDTREIIKTLDDDSIDCIVTSPPYYGLRDYGVEDQIGLESTPKQYVERLIEVFRECRRILKNSGTLWINIGDSYARDVRKGQHKPGDPGKQNYVYERGGGRASGGISFDEAGLKPKDLIGIPWLLAFALRDDGWYLRSDIIWYKPNALPESVRDRPAATYEHIFLLTKSERYFYDVDSVKIPMPDGSLKNLRNVWTVPTKPFRDAHFATFPPALIEPCIKAGCPEDGIVLDPFAGAGTTALVSSQLGRKSMLIEINPDFARIAYDRLIACNIQVDLCERGSPRLNSSPLGP